MKPHLTGHFRAGQSAVPVGRIVSTRIPFSRHQPCLPGSIRSLMCWRTAAHSSSAVGSHLSFSISRSRARGAVRAAAAADGGSDEYNALLTLKLPQLKERCKELGLPISSNKADLVQRIWSHLEAQAPAAPAAADAAAQPAAAAAAPGAGDVDYDELVREVVVELQDISPEELSSCLSDRGLDLGGTREQQLLRLAEVMAHEALDSMANQDDFPAAAAAPPPPPPPQQQQQPQGEAGGAMPPSERDWLLADKQQALQDELTAMNVTRQELINILKDLGQPAPENATQEELIESASWALAKEEVLFNEQQAAGGADAAGGDDAAAASAASEALAQHPSSMLDGLTATDINKMKVDDLRKYLRALGLSDEGSRYTLRDRLVTMLVVRKAASAGDMDHLLRQLASMTLSELRGELERRGLDLAGSKASLELRLAQAMVQEVGGPDAAGLMGKTGAKAADDQSYQPEAPLMEDYDEFLTAVVDPAFRVALICGTARHSTAASSSSSSSRLHAVSQALATAVTLVDELHTAPLDPIQAAKMEAAAAAAAAAESADVVVDSPAESSSSSSSSSGDSSSSKSKSSGKRGRTRKTDAAESAEAAAAAAAERDGPLPDPSKVPVCGIFVDVYWGDDSGSFYQLPRTALAATAPVDLAAALPALATARFESMTALAAHLKASGAGTALSLLPGGALAAGGKLAAACAAAGVPLAVQDSSSSSSGDQQQQQQPPVLGRAAVLHELGQKGYLTLPVFEVQRDQVVAAKDELEALFDAFAAAQQVPQAAADPDDAFADDEDDDEGVTSDTAAADAQQQDSSSSEQQRQKPVSPLLIAWSAARYAQDPSNSAAAAAGEEGSSDEGETPAAAEADAVPTLPAFAQAFLEWCAEHGFDPDSQLLSVSDASGGELLAAVAGGARLLQQLMDMCSQESCPPVLLLEPLHRQLSRWEVLVTVSPEDGPVSLLPVEVEAGSSKQELLDADLALQEWQMMQAGLDAATISAQLELASQEEPDCLDALKLPDSPDPLPYHTLKLHAPPRASTKLIHTMRHAAAKAVSELGLTAAGLVRVRGWYALQPDWQDAYTPQPQDIRHMPDIDARQVQKLRDEELQRRASEPLPLSDYYDEVLLLPDLSKFDPSARCRAESNGEGDVLLADVSVDVPLHTTSLAGIQAAEVGLSPGGLARHLINMALFAAGQEPLLPPPHPPALESSAQWAQASGANDTLGDIARQMADQNEELQETLETRQEAFEDVTRQAIEAHMDDEVLEQSIVDGLSFVGGTQEALEAPRQQPEEWTPEFDTRTQDEINAERDALRTEEDLAARQMRDENLPVYGDQPIQYDRYDDMLDWEPPFAAAAAAGQPIPSIEQLRQEVAARLEARRAELAEGDQDPLPSANEDEVMYGRLLEGSFYDGGVRETLRKRAEMAQETAGGGGAATMAAAALTANVEAAQAAAETAALQEASSSGDAAALAGSSLKAAADRWPWPTVEEVLDEAAERRAAQRVWVVMGGDGPGRQQALRSGANIVAKLQRCCDLQVDAFLLPPAGAGLDETRRRAALLARRTEWLALGIPESEFPSAMREDELLCMPPAERTAMQRTLIVAGPSQLARHTIEEATESAERLAQRAGTTFTGARVQERQQIQAARDTQEELDAHFISGVGNAWGGSAGRLAPAPRFLNLDEFLDEATACGATVILATHDALTATGELQHLLEGAGIGYTGVTADYALNCCNRVTLHKHIQEVAQSINSAASSQGDAAGGSGDAVGLIPMPIKIIRTEKLLDCLRMPQDCVDLSHELMEDWASDSFVLRPPADSAGLGVARIHTAEDLAAYAAAIAEVKPRLPPGSMTDQPSAVTLPLEPPALLVAEPWVETDPVAVAAGADGSLETTWAGSSSRWLEVSIGLMGELGSMSALPVTLVSRSADGSRHFITPPPAHILPQASIEAAQGCAVVLAMGLGLRSIASVDGFVNADSGELIVRDVKPSPALTDGSPLLQQAMQLDPPLLPHQLFRQLARDAWQTNLAAQAAAAAGMSSISSAYYSAPAEGAGTLGADAFNLEGLGGELFAGSGTDGFAGQDDGTAGVEDEDMAAGFTA